METHFSPHPSIHLLVTLCLIAHTGAVQKNHHRLCVRVVCVSMFAPVYCCVLLPSLCCGVLMMSWPEAWYPPLSPNAWTLSVLPGKANSLSFWLGKPVTGVSVVFLCAVLGWVTGSSYRYRWVPCSSRRCRCVLWWVAWTVCAPVVCRSSHLTPL